MANNGYSSRMAYDDPEHIDCTCYQNRALRVDERVEYFVPSRAEPGKYAKLVFAKDCPTHGYSKDSASGDAGNS